MSSSALQGAARVAQPHERVTEEPPCHSAIECLSTVAWPTLHLRAVEAFVLRDETVKPVVGSFGAMPYRPGLFVRVTDAQSCSGFGEVWANFPVGGAEYKAGLIRHYAAPLLVGQSLSRPTDALDLLESRLAALTLQVGDFGAMAQVCAGIDQAIWDLACKRVGRAFWDLAGGHSDVEVYASGIGPDDVGAIIGDHAALGHTRFKIKLGFGDAIDRRNLDVALKALPEGATLLTDANQAWDMPTAGRWLADLQAMGVGWCEEPVRADTANRDWAALAGPMHTLRLAAGENLRSLCAMAALAGEGAVRVIQPDLGKWGGITGALRLAALLPHDTWLCPHWLSGAIGQAASFQLAGALRSKAPVEIDTNPNALRTGLLKDALKLHQGSIRLGDHAGLISDLSGAWSGSGGVAGGFS